MNSEHSIDQTKQLIHFGKSWRQADRNWTADQLVAVLKISKFVTVRLTNIKYPVNLSPLFSVPIHLFLFYVHIMYQ